MGQTIKVKVDEGQGYYETDYTPYECGANWMFGILVEDGDERDLYGWWRLDEFEWKQALANANSPCFPSFEDDGDGSMGREAEKGAWDTLQRRAIDTIVDLYNEGKDEERRVRWDEADEDFVDPNAGEWRPYLLQTWHRDLIDTFKDADGLFDLLRTLDRDEALREPEAEVDTAWWDTWCSYGEEKDA